MTAAWHLGPIGGAGPLVAARHLARDPRLPLLHDHRPADDPDERRGPAGLRRLGRVPRGAPDGAVDDGVRAQGRAARGARHRVRRAPAPPARGRGPRGAGAELGARARPPPPARAARRSPRPRPWRSSCSPACRHVRRPRSRRPADTDRVPHGHRRLVAGACARRSDDRAADRRRPRDRPRGRGRGTAHTQPRACERRRRPELARRPLEPHRRVAGRRGRGRRPTTRTASGSGSSPARGRGRRSSSRR